MMSLFRCIFARPGISPALIEARVYSHLRSVSLNSLKDRFYVRSHSSSSIDAEAIDNEGCDVNAGLVYNLELEEIEPCHQLRRAFKSSPKTTPPEKIVTKWLQRGNKLTENILIKIFRAIEEAKRENQAHRLVQWVLDKKPIEITDNINLMAILAAQKSGQLNSPAKLYAQIPPERRSPAICAAMVKFYSWLYDAENAEKVLASFTPKTSVPFNWLINMHLKLGEYEKAAGVYNRLRETGIKLNDLTLLTLLKHKEHLNFEIDKGEAEAILNEGIEEMETRRTSAYAARNAMLAFAYMGDSSAVEKIWSRLRKLDLLSINAWTAAIEAFAVLGQVDQVEKIMDSFPAARGREHAFYPALVRAYAMNNRMNKAEAIIKHIRFGQQDREKTRLTYGVYDEIIQGYLDRKEHKKALEKMREARELINLSWSRPAYEVVRRMLPLYAEVKDVEGAEAMVGLVKRVEIVVFKELLKVYVAAERRIHGNRFPGTVKHDDEIRELLRKLKTFPPLEKEG